MADQDLESTEMADGETVSNRQCDDRWGLVMNTCTEIKSDVKEIKDSVSTIENALTVLSTQFESHVKQKESVWSKGTAVIMGLIALLAVGVAVAAIILRNR